MYITIVTSKSFYLLNYTHTLYRTFGKYILYIAVLATERKSVRDGVEVNSYQ